MFFQCFYRGMCMYKIRCLKVTSFCVKNCTFVIKKVTRPGIAGCPCVFLWSVFKSAFLLVPEVKCYVLSAQLCYSLPVQKLPPHLTPLGTSLASLTYYFRFQFSVTISWRKRQILTFWVSKCRWFLGNVVWRFLAFSSPKGRFLWRFSI